MMSVFLQEGLSNFLIAHATWKQTPLATEYTRAKESLKQLARVQFSLVEEAALGYSFKAQKTVQKAILQPAATSAPLEPLDKVLSAFDKTRKEVEEHTDYRAMRQEKSGIKSASQTRAQMLDPEVQCILHHPRVAKWVAQVSSEEETWRVLTFYQGDAFKEVLQRSHQQLEQDGVSKYWLFPNPVPSRVFLDAPMLTPAIALYLREHPERLIQAFQRILLMYGLQWEGEGKPLSHCFEYPWDKKQPFFDISRILITLKAAGLGERAGRPFLQALQQSNLGMNGVLKLRQWEHILAGHSVSR